MARRRIEVPEGWFDTAELIARLPAPSASMRSVVAMKRPGGHGGRDVPEAIPLTQAVALAAAACAHSRGAKRFRVVFEDVCALGDRQSEFVVVLRRGKPPEIRPAAGFEPVAAIVLDLADLRDAVLSGDQIVH